METDLQKENKALKKELERYEHLDSFCNTAKKELAMYKDLVSFYNIAFKCERNIGGINCIIQALRNARYLMIFDNKKLALNLAEMVLQTRISYDLDFSSSINLAYLILMQAEQNFITDLKDICQKHKIEDFNTEIIKNGFILHEFNDRKLTYYDFKDKYIRNYLFKRKDILDN
ncbi:hypothetical protein, partial [Campylobacter sp. MIT 97-5078]